ncbi:type I secretion system permease/ATPase [Roseinatronobacter bogoriensis]|uniref:Type I secretion system permease/ATPase n=1 Tax=Roseinatronobacter bogoriensis subsp. barguzinensis TaxID=441209 RepID=A0A2K8K898_9RHOB|nr:MULTISPECIES: type I secretion system permease/ATPase [Rhodobaca]ATX65669.1 type I secretion system permease/ATPase [Rhodobaca barguzinensis]MBB4208389.1 ATP-binding cassette subfamily C protein LapB [Rhodobaca bogoriensis DSM 18756]TDW39030.1 ATP-binding cassette subfamily C protein LapB [Rhodobaca barguzinensis]TDY68787.1 ATP-binding cassette subfamily C protein LapB [Rhodobaca bogoriensis DSM 18756]
MNETLEIGRDASVPTSADAEGMTSLEACMLHVAASLDRPITLAALQAAQSGTHGVVTLRDAITAAERAGLQAGFGRRALKDFDPSLTPAILILDDDRAVVLEDVLADGQLAVFDPALGQGVGILARDKLDAAYTGFALLMRAEHREDIALNATGRQGHWFWSTLAENRWAYSQVLLAAVLANFLSLSTSLFIMVVYDRVLPNEAIESLIALTIGVGIALLFDFLIKSLRAGFIDRAGQRADMVMGRRIFDQILDLQMRARKGSTGALASTLREFETLRDFFTSATLVAVVDLPFILLFIGVIYLIGGPLAIVPALAVPFVLIVGIAVQPILARLAEKSFADGQSKQGVLVETLSGLETIKAAGAQRQMRARWEDAIARQSDHGLKSRAVTQFAINATAFAQQGAQVMIVFYGVFLITAGEVSMGALIAGVILTGRTLAPLAQLAQTLTRFNQARTSYRSLDALMKAESERPEGKGWISRPKLDGEIKFDGVSFAYPDQSVDALRDISFTIKPGEKVAVLGRIGSGKSTVARLMLGLYQPREGAVLVDGVDIRQIDPGDLRRNMGSVLQDIWLFSGTVRENIAIGAVQARDHEIIEAARIAGVEDFVRRHPSGYDMMLAERGEGLSGGQKQAITLARALLGRRPIMLMDEPTSSMDVQNEAEVITRLKTELADRTVVIVTHRTSLLDLVDRVIVIDQGRVAADGPKSILARAGVKGGSNGTQA